MRAEAAGVEGNGRSAGAPVSGPNDAVKVEAVSVKDGRFFKARPASILADALGRRGGHSRTDETVGEVGGVLCGGYIDVVSLGGVSEGALILAFPGSPCQPGESAQCSGRDGSAATPGIDLLPVTLDARRLHLEGRPRDISRGRPGCASVM